MNYPDFKEMKPMKIWQYLQENKKTCACCQKNKKLQSFFDNIKYKISDNCKICNNRINKQKQEKEIFKIVLECLRETNINE